MFKATKYFLSPVFPRLKITIKYGTGKSSNHQKQHKSVLKITQAQNVSISV